MGAQSYKEVAIVKIIRSIDGLTEIEDAIGYADDRLLGDITDNELVSKRMLNEAGSVGFRYIAEVGDDWPVVLTNGVTEYDGETFNTLKKEVDVKQLLSPTGTQATNNGAGTIFRINYPDSSKAVIDNIEVETTTTDSVTVADRCVITIY